MGITVDPLLTAMTFFFFHLLNNTLAVLVTAPIDCCPAAFHCLKRKQIPFEKALITVTSPRNLENSFLLGSIDTSVLSIQYMNSSRVEMPEHDLIHCSGRTFFSCIGNNYSWFNIRKIVGCKIRNLAVSLKFGFESRITSSNSI